MEQKYLVMIMGALLLGGCATKKPAPLPAPAAKAAAPALPPGQAYVQCLAPYAKSKDDGVTDARAIAAKLTDVCASEFDAFLATIYQGKSPQVKESVLKGAENTKIDIAAAVVTRQRGFAPRKQ